MLKFDKRKLRRRLQPVDNPFLMLCKSIIYQQISIKAGNSIYTRFTKLFGKKKPNPKALLAISEKDLRAAGLSGQKVTYLRDIAARFLDGTVDPKRFPQMNDEEIKEHLIQIKGVGPWTADMFLIFALARPNVLPVGDLGIIKGFKKAFGLKSLPSERTMRRLAKPHHGEHSYLALYLWQVVDTEGGEEAW